MLILIILCLTKIMEAYRNSDKMKRNKSVRNTSEKYFGRQSARKEHSIFNDFFVGQFHDDIDYCSTTDYFSDAHQLLANQLGINSSHWMNDCPSSSDRQKGKFHHSNLPRQKNQNQRAGFKSKLPTLKQPLSTINTNYFATQTINNNINRYELPPKLNQDKEEKKLSKKCLQPETHTTGAKNGLNSSKNVRPFKQTIRQSSADQNRNLGLNYFDENCPPLASTVFAYSGSQKFSNQQKLERMTSPMDYDNTNNNMAPISILGCSFASDFTHDNSDYQWFVDYSYRDGVQHHSILSSLSASYNEMGELSYYDDFARNIDANLAEVDMENFRSEDIHSLLHMQQQDSQNPRRNFLLKDHAEIDNSICKSEILFSPVKESHISVDSLDMDGYGEDIILTCQANKNNYTIAFEGSCMYSDDSYYDIPENGKLKTNVLNLNMLNNDKRMAAEMTQSDAGFTTWSQLKKSSNFIQMHRYPSGNNNNTNNNNNSTRACTSHHINCPAVRKSSSMPNLKALLKSQQDQKQKKQNQLNVSEVTSTQSSLETSKNLKTMLPMYPIPITSSDSDCQMQNDNSQSNNEKVQNPPSFNLVKLFIKQKSCSSDTCMDVSSGCWPSDSTNSSAEHPGNGSNSSLNRLRKKSMNDSGKCSTLSRHEEEEYQLDSLDAQVNDKETNDFNREVFDSPTQRRKYRDCALNIRNQMKNPLLFNVLNNNNSKSQSDTSHTSENLTQILKDNEPVEDAKVTVPINMITKSIQTSMFIPPAEAKKLPHSQIKMIPPSFLSQLNKFGDKQQAPVYVIYPNYALPDLEFINQQSLVMQKDIIMSPLGYHSQSKGMAQTLNCRPQKSVSKGRRPQSLDIDKLQKNHYSHVQDWSSLLTLLPRDYKKLLKHVPEVNQVASMETSLSSQKPLFCMSPPIRRTNAMTCDCHLLFQNQTANSSSSGGSSQPPSSGYRGSSTMLTDSEMDVIINAGSGNEAMKNMFVYQYENVPDQRPPTGRKGILRRTNTTSNTPTHVTNTNFQKPKRYSMFEQQFVSPKQQPKSPQQQNFKNPIVTQQTQKEKRRSLQEPNYYNNSLEDYFNNIGGMKNFSNRLPNYMKARDNQHDLQKDLDQIMTELELNKAISNKLNFGQKIGADGAAAREIETRLNAESFLNSIPEADLKNYAELANIFEWNQQEMPLERVKLRNDVSKTISSRKVSFNHTSPSKNKNHLQAPDYEKKFMTPPNSPQMSVVTNSGGKNSDKKQQKLEKDKQDKVQSNRFKRLQIQWELLSKDAEERAMLETKSGGNTPTGHTRIQSKIPRPVSYPNHRTVTEISLGKNLRSPNKSVTQKKQTISPNNAAAMSPTVGIPRTPNKLHTTPNKTLPARSATRTR